MASVLHTVYSIRSSSNPLRTPKLAHPPISLSFSKRRLVVEATETDKDEVRGKAPAESGSSINQILGIKGAKQETVITQIWVLLLGGLGLAGLLDVWAGHNFPLIFYLAIGGSSLSYIYSAPPLKASLPRLSFKLVRGSLFAPPPRNYFIDAADGVKRMALQPISPSLGSLVIGNLMQQGYTFEFDKDRMRLSDSRHGCAVP